MNKLNELTAKGQSIWFDNLRRELLSSGELQRLVGQSREMLQGKLAATLLHCPSAQFVFPAHRLGSSFRHPSAVHRLVSRSSPPRQAPVRRDVRMSLVLVEDEHRPRCGSAGRWRTVAA
jgi:hypothetical protein